MFREQGNTVESSCLQKKYKHVMHNSVIIGCILGDAYINKYGALTIEHSIKQSEYVEWN